MPLWLRTDNKILFLLTSHVDCLNSFDILDIEFLVKDVAYTKRNA